LLEKITIKLLLWIQIVYIYYNADILHCIFLHIWIELINYISSVHRELYMAKSVSYAVSSRGMIFVEGDTAYDMDFAMFYTL
jgi:hypothetical protein